jgi:CRP/FNR family transcriptional regulator, cyclic AMP receptor protein
MMTTDTPAATLREHPFLEGVRPDHIAKLAAMASEARFEKNELIFHEADESSLFYLLVEGTVALEVNIPGRVVRVATLCSGDELGWSSLTPAHAKQFQARALEDVRAIAFDGARLAHACEEDYAFGYALMRRLSIVVASRLHATRVQLVDIYSPVAGAE